MQQVKKGVTPRLKGNSRQ